MPGSEGTERNSSALWKGCIMKQEAVDTYFDHRRE
jgi:hypothetical protein